MPIVLASIGLCLVLLKAPSLSLLKFTSKPLPMTPNQNQFPISPLHVAVKLQHMDGEGFGKRKFNRT